MKSYNSLDKRKKIIVFSLILLATTAIGSFVMASVWQEDEDVPFVKMEHTKEAIVSPTRYNILIACNDLLSSRLNSLQQLDQQYAKIVTDTKDKKTLDSINQMIDVQEENFRGYIDSIFLNKPDQPDSALNNLFNNILASYRSILQNRHSMSSLRNAVSQDKKSLNPGEMATLRIQNELQEKNNRIASLESEVRIMSASRLKKIIPKEDDASAANAGALKENITEQENRIALLMTVNNSLKQDNERLIKQQNDASRETNSGELSLKNKAAGMLQKIDELNAELRLAQVDCNLSRVDAGQIISNSRQRKALLSEASGILTSLAKSDDADIRKKVQDKISRLNQVAANSRD